MKFKITESASHEITFSDFLAKTIKSRVTTLRTLNLNKYGQSSIVKSLPDELLKLPEGHEAQAPADAPPQPLRYCPAKHAEALQAEQVEAPEPNTSREYA